VRHTNDLAVLIERWFTDRLMKHRGVGPHTVASYRDTFRLLFAFAQMRLGRSTSQLTLRDIDAPFISAFGENLETKRSPLLNAVCGGELIEAQFIHESDS
jgi:integrase/recombinase XerD